MQFDKILFQNTKIWENNSFMLYNNIKIREDVYFAYFQRWDSFGRWWMWKEILRVIHVFNNLLLGSCSGQLRLRPARTRPFVNYIIHKNNGMYKCREKC